MERTSMGRAIVLSPPTFIARRKAALRAVVAQLNTSALKPTSFESFAVAPERRLWSSLHNPQIHSTCVEGIEGAEFRTFFGLGNAGPVRRTSIVNHVLDDAQAFVSAARAGRLDAPLRTAEKLAERINHEAARRSCTMHVKAIGLYPDPFTNECCYRSTSSCSATICTRA